MLQNFLLSQKNSNSRHNAESSLCYLGSFGIGIDEDQINISANVTQVSDVVPGSLVLAHLSFHFSVYILFTFSNQLGKGVLSIYRISKGNACINDS
jgi:hypothetical protein